MTTLKLTDSELEHLKITFFKHWDDCKSDRLTIAAKLGLKLADSCKKADIGIFASDMDKIAKMIEYYKQKPKGARLKRTKK